MQIQVPKSKPILIKRILYAGYDLVAKWRCTFRSFFQQNHSTPFFDRKLEIGPTFQNVYIYFLGESPLRLVSKERAEIGVVSTNL